MISSLIIETELMAVFVRFFACQTSLADVGTRHL